MRNMRMRMRIENLIHIIHIWIFAKNGNFLGQKWVSLALFSILSAQNIIIVHTSWFYPSSGMKIKSPKSQNFGQEKMIFFYYWCGLCALMRIWCASMRISKNRRMASPSTNEYSVVEINSHFIKSSTSRSQYRKFCCCTDTCPLLHLALCRCNAFLVPKLCPQWSQL